MAFDIERFVGLSKAVDVSDIDWKEARRVGITDEEAQILRYMQDVESHTILYLRDLLTGFTARDPEVTTFLACWVYEETYHGRALDRFLVEVGRPPARDRHDQVHGRPSFRERLTGWTGRMAANATPHFAAVHMAWGAANEFCAALSYTQLARRTENAPLRMLCNRLAKDERRHFAFYFDQAQKRLRAGGVFAQKLCALMLGRFWEPVGMGVGGPSTIDLCASYLFDGPRGRRAVAEFDEVVRSLPGMEFWSAGMRWAEAGSARFRTSHPEAYARHRAQDERFDHSVQAA